MDGVKRSGLALLLMSFSLAVAAQGQASTSSNPPPQAEVVEGARIAGFEDKLKSVFPQATLVKETSMIPNEFGGTSLMGLIHRLLGESVNREQEGLKTRRYIYRALNGDKIIGLGHASRAEVDGQKIEVALFYDTNGVVRDIKLENVPTKIHSDLESGGYLKQFIGRNSEDFEVTLGRKGRIKSRGAFFTQAKRPGNSPLRNYFEKIWRSVRFNAAFMEVAYFLAQHPGESEAAANSLSGQQSLLKSPFTLPGSATASASVPTAAPAAPETQKAAASH